MTKFIAFYHAPASVLAKNAQMTKEEQAKGLQAWFAWKETTGDHVVDFGAPLMPGQRIDKSKNWSATQTTVTGYTVLQGDNLAQVQALFNNHPHLAWGEGCSIDIHEYAKIG